MPIFSQKEIELHFQEKGSGVAFVFQHGLGADLNQPFGMFTPPPGIRMIAFDARGHGRSAMGNREVIGLGTSADDLRALLKHLQISSAVIGGISMGAAIALNFAVRFPEATLGVVLSRPAWLDGPNPFNVKMFGLISDLICTVGPHEGLRLFQESAEFRELEREFPDTAMSLCNQFRHPRAYEMALNLRSIPEESPIASMEVLRQIQVPALVLANRRDPIHPFEYGVRLAQEIPRAHFQEIVSKTENWEEHLRQVQEAINKFLSKHFFNADKPC